MALSLTIGHLDLKYRVPRGQAVAGLERRMNGLAAGALCARWETYLAASGLDGEAHVFIDALRVPLCLELRAEEPALADAWARALHAEVMRAARSTGPGVEVFEDRASFLAAFVAHRLGAVLRPGRFQEFDALGSMATGPLVARVLGEDPDHGRDALRLLDQGDLLGRLLAVLSEAEVETLVSLCLVPPAPETPLLQRMEAWAEALAPLLREGADLELDSSVPRNVVRTYLLLLRRRPDLGPDVHLARFVRDLMSLRQRLLELHDLPGALALVAAADGLARVPGAGRERVLQDLVARIGGPPAADLVRDLVRRDVRAAACHPTSFGGLFLLAGTVRELELPVLLSKHPWPEGTEAGLILWLVAAGCVGPEDPQGCARDPGLALFAGLDGPPTRLRLAGLAERLAGADAGGFSARLTAELAPRLGRPGAPLAMERVAAEAARCAFLPAPLLGDPPWARALGLASAAVLRSFATRLGGFADSSIAYLRRNVLSAPGRVEVLPDRMRVWLDACPLQVVLRMAGLDEPAVAPWLKGRHIESRFP